MPFANNKGADQLAHPRSLISTFVVRFLDSIIPMVFISETSRLYLASEAEQAGLCLTLAETPKTGFLMPWLNYEMDIINCFNIVNVDAEVDVNR